jgi:hypothetical protein
VFNEDRVSVWGDAKAQEIGTGDGSATMLLSEFYRT